MAFGGEITQFRVMRGTGADYKLGWWANGLEGCLIVDESSDLYAWRVAGLRDCSDGPQLMPLSLGSKRGFCRLRNVTRNALLTSESAQWFYDGFDESYAMDLGPSVSNLISRWDALVAAQVATGDESLWAARCVLGPSSVGGFDIIRYDFRPESPTKMMILTGVMHGSETMAPHLLLRIFKELAENAFASPILAYLRDNVHFVVIPVCNPWGYENNERRCRETDPIPVTWSRSGTTAILTLHDETFPDTHGRLMANGYIGPGSEGKLVVSLQSSSDMAPLPDRGYVVDTVLDSHSFAVSCLDTGGVSGSCEMFVLTDPNRQFDVNDWEAFSSLSWADAKNVPYSNKGTRPYALAEMAYLRSLLVSNSSARAYLDFHNGPPARYAVYYGAKDSFDRAPVDALLGMLAPEPDDVLVAPNQIPTGTSFAAQMFGMQSFTPETSSPSGAEMSLRWWLNLLSAYALLH